MKEQKPTAWWYIRATIILIVNLPKLLPWLMETSVPLSKMLANWYAFNYSKEEK